MKTEVILNQWQKKQATLLYEFSSIGYLIGMKKKLDLFIKNIEEVLDRAKTEKRDMFLSDDRWGNRNTSENWSNNAWPHLKDFQMSIAKQISERVNNIYGYTDMNNCARAISEYSIAWQSHDEENVLHAMFVELGHYASRIDDTLQKTADTYRWDDFSLTLEWNKLKEPKEKIPKFIVRTDIIAKTRIRPPRTGVYVLQGDENATLQFAWTGDESGMLIPTNTFNALGISVLGTVGRPDLWKNRQKMHQFALVNKNNKLLKSDNFYAESLTQDLASSLIARTAFCATEGDWYYVELIGDEFEDIDASDAISIPTSSRIPGGDVCPKAGYYFTPSKVNSRRHFEVGELMPTIDSPLWLTIWQSCD